jgi:hypothetical protein
MAMREINGPAAPRATMGKVALAAASIVATVLALEAALRVGAHLENRGLLSALAASEAPAPGSRVTLGRMIRPSTNPRIIYELRPLLSRVVYEGGSVSTNSHGFRAAERPIEKPATAFRIVGIGDSYMFGQGVSDDETYLARLEASLRGGPATRDWQVVNTAVPGYNTVMQVEALKARGLPWRPDVVVLEVTGNDLDLPNFIRTPEDPARGRSFLAAFVARRLGRLEARDRPEGLVGAPEEDIPGGAHFLDDPARVPPEYRDMVGLKAWEKALADLREVGARNGIPIVVVTEGISFDRRLRRLSGQHGFHYLDVAKALRQYLKANGYREHARSPLVISPRDLHPSPIAHEIIARELRAFLDDRGLLPDGPPPGG